MSLGRCVRHILDNSIEIDHDRHSLIYCYLDQVRSVATPYYAKGWNVMALIGCMPPPSIFWKDWEVTI